MIPDAALVAALMSDKAFRSCVASAGQGAPSASVAKDFDFRALTLHSGAPMVVAVGRDVCGWQGQAARVLIYERTPAGYKLVLDEFSLPEQVSANADGTVGLAAHETMNTILQSTYVWNGTKFAFSPERSSVYCVGPDRDNERPYELPIHFPRGASSMVLRGTASDNCGQRYSFIARAGQRVKVERLTPQPANLRIPVFLDFGNDEVAEMSGDAWSGTLTRSGKYVLDVFGSDQRGDIGLQPYALRLTIW